MLEGNVGHGILRRVTGGAGGEDFQQARREAVGLSGSHPIKLRERGGDIVFQFVDHADGALVLGNGGVREGEREKD